MFAEGNLIAHTLFFPETSTVARAVILIIHSFLADKCCLSLAGCIENFLGRCGWDRIRKFNLRQSSPIRWVYFVFGKYEWAGTGNCRFVWHCHWTAIQLLHEKLEKLHETSWKFHICQRESQKHRSKFLLGNWKRKVKINFGFPISFPPRRNENWISHLKPEWFSITQSTPSVMESHSFPPFSQGNVNSN